MTNLGACTPMNNLGTIRAVSRDLAVGKEMNGSTRLIHTLFRKENERRSEEAIDPDYELEQCQDAPTGRSKRRRRPP